MLGRVLYAAALFLLLKYTMDSQPTDKVEGVGDDFVRGGRLQNEGASSATQHKDNLCNKPEL